jgi:hypothetical protein
MSGSMRHAEVTATRPWPAAVHHGSHGTVGRASGRPTSSTEPRWREVCRPAKHLRPGSRQPHRPTQPPVRATHLRIVSGTARLHGVGRRPAQGQATVRRDGRQDEAAGVVTERPYDPLEGPHSHEHRWCGVIHPTGALARLESVTQLITRRMVGGDHLPGDHLPDLPTSRQTCPKPTAPQHISATPANILAARCFGVCYTATFE